MEELTFWEDIKDEIDESKWIPSEIDFAEFVKELEDEIDFLIKEKREFDDRHITQLKQDIQEFKDSDSDKKVELIKMHVYCYGEMCPIQSYSPLWIRVLGLNEIIKNFDKK